MSCVACAKRSRTTASARRANVTYVKARNAASPAASTAVMSSGSFHSMESVPRSPGGWAEWDTGGPSRELIEPRVAATLHGPSQGGPCTQHTLGSHRNQRWAARRIPGRAHVFAPFEAGSQIQGWSTQYHEPMKDSAWH